MHLRVNQSQVVLRQTSLLSLAIMPINTCQNSRSLIREVPIVSPYPGTGLSSSLDLYGCCTENLMAGL